MVHKKELTFVLRQTMKKDLPYCKLKVIFRSKCRLNALFRFKYSLEKKNPLWNNLSLYV